MKPVEINLNDHLRGDTWEGLTIGPILVNGIAPVSPCVSCRIQFREKKLFTLGYELSSVPAMGKGTITIDDPNTWEFSALSQILPLEAGSWRWEFETVDSAGSVISFYSGTIKIVQDVVYGE